MENINSLYFLSKQNDSQTLKALPRGGMFNRATEITIDSCIQHLEEVNKLKVIRNSDMNDFLSNNPDIFYDNDKDKRPCCDVVYTKINKHYFVKNSEYYEKITQYYFTIYSAIFPHLGLNTITLKQLNQTEQLNNMNLDFNLIACTAGMSNVISENNYDENTIKMVFEEDCNDINTINKLKSNKEQQVDIIYNDLFSDTMKKSLYKTGIINELDLIEKRFKTKLNSFTKQKIIKNTNTHSIRLNFCQSFNLNTNIGLLAGYENNEFMTHQVCYVLDFYKLQTNSVESVNEIVEEPQPSDNSIVIPKPQEPPVNMIKNFYTSQPPAINGPWPIGCKSKRAVNNIKDLETARKKAYNMIKEDPIHHIVEIVEMFNFDLSSIFYNRKYSVYSVKLCYAEPNSDADVHIGNGRRYVAFDSEQFCCRNKVIQTLQNESFY